MKNVVNYTGLSLLWIALASCGGKDDPAPVIAIAPQATACTRAQPAVAEHVEGSCRIRLVSPAACEEIDLTTDKTYEFVWTTDGTRCNAPYKIYLAGNPVGIEVENRTNIRSKTVTSSRGPRAQTRMVAKVRARDFGLLKSSDGSFEWTVEGNRDSRPASQVFRVKQ